MCVYAFVFVCLYLCVVLGGFGLFFLLLGFFVFCVCVFLLCVVGFFVVFLFFLVFFFLGGGLRGWWSVRVCLLFVFLLFDKTTV